MSLINMRASRICSSRRSQMEIMGLMIVVILFIIGVLFAVKFVIFKKAPETRQQYTKTQLASNLGIAMLETTTLDCRGTAIKDLLMDCASWQPSGTILCDDAEHSASCDYVRDAIGSIVADTLDTWSTRYELKAYMGTREPFVYFNNGGCTDKVPGESESFFLPTQAGDVMTLKIFICG